MDYTEAIRLALAGEERGFYVLYEKTYQKKYFLALQYMKNEAAAEDVMQESYIRAFSKLDTLEDPEKFPAWFGMIVANMAKNALKKRNPMLFSDIETEDGQEMFEYQIEDENIEHMPEMAYTREETRQLTYELLDSLSEEQRMCILMFHIEGLSIKEIAFELGCSENTVKSRLKYGRDNIKKKGEELQKKGYQLYSAAPLPLFLYLLQEEAVYMKADGSLRAAGLHIADRVVPSCGKQTAAGAYEGAQEFSGNGMKSVKSGFLHTVAGKVISVVVVLGLVGGAVIYFASQQKTDENEIELTVKMEMPEIKKEEPEVKDEIPDVTVKELQDSEYETLIAGNLTKEELQFVLAYGPQEIPEQGFKNNDYFYLLNFLCMASMENEDGRMIESFGLDAEWRAQFSVSDVNRMFRAFTDYQLDESNNTLAEYNVQVQGITVAFSGASIDRTSNAVITAASYTEEEMDIYYTYDTITSDMAMDGLPKETEHRKAVLRPDAAGLYQIVKIEVIEEQDEEDYAIDAETAGEQEPISEEMEKNVEFPVGTYSNVAETGGYRGSFTIDSSGIATYEEWSGATGKGLEIKYQMSIDNTVTVQDGVTAYLLVFIEGHEFQMTESDDEVTGYLEEGNNMSLYYDKDQGILQDENGSTWEIVE